MNRAALSTMIAQLGMPKVPTLERMAILQEALDTLADRIESLERQVRSVRLQQRPFKMFSPSASTTRPVATRQGMAASAEQGTARKLVTRNGGRTMSKSEERGDGRERPPMLSGQKRK